MMREPAARDVDRQERRMWRIGYALTAAAVAFALLAALMRPFSWPLLVVGVLLFLPGEGLMFRGAFARRSASPLPPHAG
jgi:hypothetical protein